MKLTSTLKMLALAAAVAGTITESKAQVGIGTSSPAGSAMLDVSSTNRGFLPPRVALTGTTDVSTISSPTAGLLVYCSGTGGLAAGYYYWSGSAWTALGGGSNLYTADGTLSGNRTVSTASGYTLTFSPQVTFGSTLTAASAKAFGARVTPSLTAAANNDTLIGLEIWPNFTPGAYTGLTTYGLRVQGHGIGTGGGSEPSNVAVGLDALKSNTTGQKNSAFGYNALKSNNGWNGKQNTAVGWGALTASGVTSDNAALGYAALYSNTSGSSNTAVGSMAAFSNTSGNQNSAFGVSALFANTSGLYNTAIGYFALSTNQTGHYSTAVGYEALKNFKSTSTSDNNLAIGYRAMLGAANYTGKDNIGIGYMAMNAITTGYDNVTVGTSSMNANTTGSNNVGMGSRALYLNTTGGANTAIGFYSMYNNSTGQNNTAVGVNALNYNETGSFNTAVGYGAGPVTGSTALQNTTGIGYGATVSASNTIQIGNSSITYIGGQVGFTAASDRRIKEDIRNSRYGLKDVMKLRAVDYTLTSNRLQQVGFVAQEVQAIVPEVVTGKEGDLSKGEILGVTYGNLVPVLTKAIQEQQALIERLQLEVKALKAAMEAKK